MARGVIGSPFEVTPFQVDLLSPASPSVERHSTSDCSTTYPQHSLTNPLAGLVIHRPDPSNKPSVPLYSAVRSSATSKNQDWFQTNVPQPESSALQWVHKIQQATQRLVSRQDALETFDADSDSEDTEDEFEEEDESRTAVHPYRFRFWGMVTSPGGGSTAALVSKYSTQLPSRQAFCRLYFGAQTSNRPGEPGEPSPPVDDLTTEGRMWEWMYGNGGGVLGATIPAADIASRGDDPVRRFFQDVKNSQETCAFCDGELRNDGTEARCPNNHAFATCTSSGLAILAPGVSRVCAVCQRRCLKHAELLKLAKEHFGPDVSVPSLSASCGACGGKFVA